MPAILDRRVMAEIDGDFVVFLIGMRINRRSMKDSRGDVGIWHETYLVRAGEYECVYSGMPLMGLAKAARSTELAAGTDSARDRLGLGARQ